MAVDLTIDPDTVRALVLKARAMGARESDPLAEDGSNLTDDDAHAALAGTFSDATGEETAGMIEALSERERAELVAMTWLGRGDYEAAEFPDAVEAARERASGNNPPTARYLLEQPLLGDYLAEALDALGHGGMESADETPR